MELENLIDKDFWKVEIVIRYYPAGGSRSTIEGFCSGPRFNNINEATDEMLRVHELSKWDDD